MKRIVRNTKIMNQMLTFDRKNPIMTFVNDEGVRNRFFVSGVFFVRILFLIRFAHRPMVRDGNGGT